MRPYYSHGRIEIYLGDCRDVLPHLVAGGGIVVDPPYGIGWWRRENKARASKSHSGIQNDESVDARDAMLEMRPNTPAAVFGSFYAPFPAKLRQVLIWHKPPDSGVVGSFTGFRRDAEPVFLVGPWPSVGTVHSSGVLRSSQMGMGAICAATGHPHTKPVDILRTLINAMPEGLIEDPFMGTGSTLLACKQLGRAAVGIEIEERYCEIAAERLSQDFLDFGECA